MNTILTTLSSNRTYFFVFGTIIVIVVGSLLFAGGVTVWEYTNSSEFCGTTCHTMPPEYTAYKISPHARVPCVDCHLGMESVLTIVPRKVKEVRHVLFALTQNYETPIYVKSLRPARYTCEKCHNPEKFSDDSLRVIRHYSTDEKNSETRIYLVMKTGGGTRREGLGKGIHWHIENEVWYIATDEHKQNIPYVRQVDENGQVIEYFDVTAALPSDFVARNSDKLRRMDCIDCHNRISHTFRSPERAMDWVLSRRLIDRNIPYIKAKGVEVLSATYESHDEAAAAIERLEEWYRANYPEWYQVPDNQAKLKKAIEELKRIYSETVFPEMDVGWETHPDNIGHLEFPGCFRCHDGKHLSPQEQAIRLECNICHSIPEVVGPGDPAPVISVEKPNEPDSHKDTQWLARHRFEFDQTCTACHDVANPGGADNSSFCSNSACHGVEWRYAGLDAPAIAQKLKPAKEKAPIGVPAQVPHPVGPRTDCEICHGLQKVHPYPENHTQFDATQCTGCHPVIQEALIAPSGSPTPEAVTGPAPIPHPLEGREDCLICHAVGSGVKPAPPDHEGRTSDLCQACHKPAATPTPASGRPTNTPTPTPAQPVSTPTPQATVGPASIPHPLEGREDCLICHAVDSAVKPAPPDHEGRTSDLCQVCHKPAATPTPASGRPTNTPTPTPAQPVSTPTPQATVGPASIPHPLEGREDCLICHAVDSAVKPAPPDHEGRTSDLCQACHAAAPTSQAGEEEVASPPSMPQHPLEVGDDCLLCHAVDSQLKPAPEDHEGRSVESCQVCHKPES